MLFGWLGRGAGAVTVIPVWSTVTAATATWTTASASATSWGEPTGPLNEFAGVYGDRLDSAGGVDFVYRVQSYGWLVRSDPSTFVTIVSTLTEGRP